MITVRAIRPKPIDLRCRMVIVSDTDGRSLPVSSTTVCSMSRTTFSPCSSRPWMNSQRGLSGT